MTKVRTPHPLRVRLYGGRVVHAARWISDSDGLTACDYFLGDYGGHDWRSARTPIQCARCLRILTPA
jgi:hypothetical protein